MFFELTIIAYPLSSAIDKLFGGWYNRGGEKKPKKTKIAFIVKKMKELFAVIKEIGIIGLLSGLVGYYDRIATETSKRINPCRKELKSIIDNIDTWFVYGKELPIGRPDEVAMNCSNAWSWQSFKNGDETEMYYKRMGKWLKIPMNEFEKNILIPYIELQLQIKDKIRKNFPSPENRKLLFNDKSLREKIEHKDIIELLSKTDNLLDESNKLLDYLNAYPNEPIIIWKRLKNWYTS